MTGVQTCALPILSGESEDESYSYGFNDEELPENLEEDGVSESSNIEATGILQLIEGHGYGFLRFHNFMTSKEDLFVPANLIHRFWLRTGDEIKAIGRKPRPGDKFGAVFYIKEVNGKDPVVSKQRSHFDSLTPIYPKKRIYLETKHDMSTRIIDLLAPVGFGQRGLIVAQPKAGKTVLLKKIARAIETSYPEAELIVLLVDERPEEVTDIQRYLQGESTVIYSTFDEKPEHHAKVSEMVLERAKRLAEDGRDVVILLDSLTRLARAYNIIEPSSGKILSGGLDPISLYKPKKFFGAARNLEDGGSITILATALVETGSRMDDMIFEEFKGTGNMELHLDRNLSEKRIFPAIDFNKSGTRNEELIMTQKELEAEWMLRKALSKGKNEDVTQSIVEKLSMTDDNETFISLLDKLDFAK